MISNNDAFIVELHSDDLNNNDEELFYRAIKDSLTEFGVDIKREKFYTENHMIYYLDGLRMKQVGRIDRDNNHLVFVLYLDAPQDFGSLSLIEYFKQRYLTSLGGLRDLNENINFSIRDKIIRKYSEYAGKLALIKLPVPDKALRIIIGN